ncbi:uncharacterized protein RAG0_04945 [Rhynchosporium agropyri]|uniref:Uncharacterized protein n=1 Tax=Rhynchosporium agropyri TaxID=914238 RepID=A0A1E1KAV2_9HELO|nr:uncharacterized protein RAG0_04945 [Rhynchosporium agropyri]
MTLSSVIHFGLAEFHPGTNSQEISKGDGNGVVFEVNKEGYALAKQRQDASYYSRYCPPGISTIYQARNLYSETLHSFPASINCKKRQHRVTCATYGLEVGGWICSLKSKNLAESFPVLAVIVSFTEWGFESWQSSTHRHSCHTLHSAFSQEDLNRDYYSRTIPEMLRPVARFSRLWPEQAAG